MENEEEIVVLEEETEKEIVTFEEDAKVGTNNYEKLLNKPKINNVELIGNKKSKDLKIQDEMEVLSNLEIEKMINNFI